MSAATRIHCPHCGGSMKLPGAKAGDTVLCPRCSGSVVIAATEPAGKPAKPVTKEGPLSGNAPRRPKRSGGPEAPKPLVAAIPAQHQATRQRSDNAEDVNVPLPPEPLAPQASAWGPNADLFSFDCLICGTRLTAHRGDAGQRIPCPDCGTMAVVPEPRIPASARLRGTDGWPVSDKEPSGLDELPYRLEPPVARNRPRPHLVDVCEEELFAGESGTTLPHSQATQPCSGVTDRSTQNDQVQRPVLPSADAAKAATVEDDPSDKSSPGSSGPAKPDTPSEHAGAYAEAYSAECPVCGTSVLVWPDQVGQQVHCPDCSSTFRVAKRVKRPQERTFPTREFGDDIRFLDDWPATTNRGSGNSDRRTESGSGSTAQRLTGGKLRQVERSSSEDRSNSNDILCNESGVKLKASGRSPVDSPSTGGGHRGAESGFRNKRAARLAGASPFERRSPSVDCTCGEAEVSSVAESDLSPPSDTERLRRFLETPYLLLLVRQWIQPRVLLCIVLAAGIGIAIAWLMHLVPEGTSVVQLKLIRGIRGAALIIIGLLVLLGFCCNVCLHVIEASANGTDRLEEPILLPVVDAVTVAVATVSIFCISCLPGAAVAMAVWSFLPQYGLWALVPSLLLSECVCLPVVALSQLSSNRPCDFLCVEVLEALLRRKGAWLRYAIVVGLCWAATASSLLFYGGLWWPMLVSVLWVATGFLHANALGILAAEAMLAADESRGPTRKVGRGAGKRKETASSRA